uniref:Uncharacterized protein n=1 Tax=Rhizophora mucronata TaxID=61149 RepID=A0A2P2N8N3_RHIMU
MVGCTREMRKIVFLGYLGWEYFCNYSPHISTLSFEVQTRNINEGLWFLLFFFFLNIFPQVFKIFLRSTFLYHLLQA